jgi:hypothetical protein
MWPGLMPSLIGAKLIACTLTALCIYPSRARVIVWADYFFAMLIVWNLLMILRSVVK